MKTEDSCFDIYNNNLSYGYHFLTVLHIIGNYELGLVKINKNLILHLGLQMFNV